MKIGRNASSGRFTTSTSTKGRSRATAAGTVKIRDEKSGKELPLKGYGSMRGKFQVGREVDLTKPIAAQTLSKKKK